MTKILKKEHTRLYFIFSFLLLIAITTICCAGKASKTMKKYTYHIEATHSHDVQAYTQGLFIHEGILYESTGQYGQSSMRKVDLATGRVIEVIPLQKKYFAEGACVLNNKIYQLTWVEQTGFVYDLNTFKEIAEFRFQGEGWGLTTDGKQLIMSDGSSVLRFMNPDNFAEERHINVTYEGTALPLLNELEYINGEIWANVYTKDYIVRIDPVTGKINSVLLMQGLLPLSLHTSHTDVLNGIAYDTATKKIYITGKNWPKLYEISLVEVPDKK